MGIDQSKVDALLARARREVDEGLLPSTQVALAYQGELVAFEAYGDADLDTRYPVFSATKAFVASTVWTLIGEGLVDPSKRVVDYIPEFGTNGKDVITVEQVMLHTVRLPARAARRARLVDREGRVEAVRRAGASTGSPARTYEYHADLRTLGARGDHRPRHRQRLPRRARAHGSPARIGLPRVLGIAEDEQDNVASSVPVGELATPEEIKAAFGIGELPVTEVTRDALLAFNSPR